MQAEATIRQDTSGAYIITGIYHPEILASGTTREEAVAKWHEARAKWIRRTDQRQAA